MLIVSIPGPNPVCCLIPIFFGKGLKGKKNICEVLLVTASNTVPFSERV
jgi:hypothetical protein